VAGDRAHVLSGPVAVRDLPRLVRLDLSDPASPTVDAELQLRSGFGIATAGGHAVVAAGSIGLLTAGAADGEALAQLAVVPTLGSPGGVVVEGARGYATDWDGELWVLDATDPQAPRELAHLEPRRPAANGLADRRLYGATGLAVQAGRAYVSSVGVLAEPGAMAIVDLSDPATPRQAGGWDPYSEWPAREVAYDPNGYAPAIAGDRMFVTGEPLLAELDVALPAAPRFGRAV
jgi:hypothetical protein